MTTYPMTPRVVEVKDNGPVFADWGYDEQGYWCRTNAKIKRVRCIGCWVCSFWINLDKWEMWLEFDKEKKP